MKDILTMILALVVIAAIGLLIWRTQSTEALRERIEKNAETLQEKLDDLNETDNNDPNAVIDSLHKGDF